MSFTTTTLRAAEEVKNNGAMIPAVTTAANASIGHIRTVGVRVASPRLDWDS